PRPWRCRSPPRTGDAAPSRQCRRYTCRAGGAPARAPPAPRCDAPCSRPRPASAPSGRRPASGASAPRRTGHWSWRSALLWPSGSFARLWGRISRSLCRGNGRTMSNQSALVALGSWPPSRPERLRRPVLDVRSVAPQAPSGEDPRERVAVAGIPWKTAARAATVGIFFFLFWAVLEQARPILLPVVSAFVIGFMLGPLSALASRYGLPSWLSATLLMACFIGLLSLALTLMSAPVVEWIGKAPEIGRTVEGKLRVLDRPLAALRDLRKALIPSGGGELKIDI